jgi:hypothetical protein
MAPGVALPHDKAEVLVSTVAQRRPLRFGPLCAAVIAGTVVTAGAVEVPPVQRLHLATFALAPHADAPFQHEGARLDGLCGADVACRAKRLRTTTRRIAPLHADEGVTSPVVGYVVARLGLDASGAMTFALDIESGTEPDRRQTWIASVGDYTYGIHVAGVRPRPEWLQLVGLPIVGDAWTPRTGADWTAHVEPLDGGIVVELQPMEAMFPDGSTRMTERGSYVVTDVHGDRVAFRAEVGSDYDCGADVPRPAVMPPLLRAPAGAFFDADGTPRFAEKYTKGC